MGLRQRLLVRCHAPPFPGKGIPNALDCSQGSENEPPVPHPFLGCVSICAGVGERVSQAKRNHPRSYTWPLVCFSRSLSCSLLLLALLLSFIGNFSLFDGFSHGGRI